MSKDLPPVLGRIYERLKVDSAHMIGYPSTHVIDFSPLYSFLNLFLNNIGDPFKENTFKVNTHDIERAVINWFREILHAGKESVWGYVTGGGTEGNMYGLYLAREVFPDGIIYYSEDTHYSVGKILRMFKAENTVINSNIDGEMDYNDLGAKLAAKPGVPPIIFANIGTTMRGAVDNLDKIKAALNKEKITRYYIHADAALSGMILPFVDDPQPFDFAAGIDSISISGHKMPGLPLPCGVVLAKEVHVARIKRAVEYVGTNDTTVTGSRSGITPLLMWYLINQVGEEGFRDIAKNAMAIADYAITQLAAHGVTAWRHKNSLTVVFPRQSEKALKKWQIATQGNEAHLIAMPHVTKNQIDEFIQDYMAPTLKQHKEKEAII